MEQNELGRKPWEAILEACQQRLRPILLTTFTTMLGLILLYLGGGLMWEPMAMAIIVGSLVWDHHYAAVYACPVQFVQSRQA